VFEVLPDLGICTTKTPEQFFKIYGIRFRIFFRFIAFLILFGGIKSLLLRKSPLNNYQSMDKSLLLYVNARIPPKDILRPLLWIS
jgi:hypothetical protein